MKSRRNGVLVAIAIFRLVKAVGLLLIGAEALHLVHPAAARTFREWFTTLPFLHDHPELDRVATGLSHLTPTRMRELAIAAFAYAALFISEGLGLLRGKRWAEWLTIIATTSFIPFEIVEVIHKTTPIRITVVVLNAVIVMYLIWRRMVGDRLALFADR